MNLFKLSGALIIGLLFVFQACKDTTGPEEPVVITAVKSGITLTITTTSSGTDTTYTTPAKYFDSELQPVFSSTEAGCTGCHVNGSRGWIGTGGGEAGKQGLTLESTDSSLSGLVSIVSYGDHTMLRVKPSDPENSALYLKLIATDDFTIDPPFGDRMPPFTDKLSDSTLQKVYWWIKAGASKL